MDPTLPNASANTTSVLEPGGNGGVGEKATQVGQAAKEGATESLAAVKQEMSAATSDMAGQARNLLNQSRGQVRTEAQAQTEKLSQSLRTVGTQMHALADGRPEEAGPVADYARQAAQSVSRYADSIQERGLDGVLRDTQQFARRRPGTFLLGALVAGALAGRLVRNAKELQQEESSSSNQLSGAGNGMSHYPPPSAPLGTVGTMGTMGSLQASDGSGSWERNDPAWGVS
ncbi:MAG: hypothetical protein JWL70_48 [Acidimicrobiia bacterium]|nr:hypothetical protein [Acidimicrobiia bacterium]